MAKKKIIILSYLWLRSGDSAGDSLKKKCFIPQIIYFILKENIGATFIVDDDMQRWNWFQNIKVDRRRQW